MLNIYMKTEYGWEKSHRSPEDLANHVKSMGLCPAFESRSDGFALVYVYQTKHTPVVLVANTPRPRIGEDIAIAIAPQNWGYARYLDEFGVQEIWGKKYPSFKPSMFGRVVLSTTEQVRWCINNK